MFNVYLCEKLETLIDALKAIMLNLYDVANNHYVVVYILKKKMKMYKHIFYLKKT